VTSGLVAIIVLLLAIPARHLALNERPDLLLGFLILVFALAAILGRRAPLRAGFCNSFCPVLPVERLYGQTPLLDMGSPKCPSCTGCSPLGCVDLEPEKSIHHVLGPVRKTRAWVLTPFGAFAAAFPAVVLAYFLTPDGSISDAARVYGVSFAAGVAGWGTVALLVAATGWSARTALPVLGAVAVGVYYWFAIPGGMALAQAEFLTPWIRTIALLGITGWCVRSLIRSSRPLELSRWAPQG
jgi:hypothetical protein